MLVLALVLASCGGGSSSTSTSQSAKVSSAPARQAPSSNGLDVGATDLKLGDATESTDAGQKLLAGPSRPDPARLRDQVRKRSGVGAGDACPDQDTMPTAETMPQVVASTLCLLNGERADAGLPPLKQNSELDDAAVAHSRDMLAKHYFNHESPGGSRPVDRIKATGYAKPDENWIVGENIALGTGTLATPKSIVVAWMNSKGHRENILRAKFNEIGLGIVVGTPDDGSDGATYTTTFGSLGNSSSSSGSTAAVSDKGSSGSSGTQAGTSKVKSACAARARAARAKKGGRKVRARAAVCRAAKKSKKAKARR